MSFLAIDLETAFNNNSSILSFEYRKKPASYLHVVVVVMRELVGVVSLVLVNDCEGVSDEMVHTVVAGARAHLGFSK